MRNSLAASLALLAMLAAAQLSEAASRYGIAVDSRSYPQTTAKETLQSVLKAIEAKRYDYLMAQLADPTFVDDRVKRLYGGRFAEQVEDTHDRLDSRTVQLLRRFLKDGEWSQDPERVSVRLKDQERQLHFKKVQDRWYMENSCERR